MSFAYAGPSEEYDAGVKSYKTGDVVAAMSLLRHAADAGHAPAQVLLAEVLRAAEFSDEALKYYRKAAEQGDAEGEFGLGSMYAAGEGTARDLAEARKWIGRAAEQGHRPATVALAFAYIKGGLAVSENERKDPQAFEWIKRAADMDDIPALEALAAAYRNGAYGLTPDAKHADEIAAKVALLRGQAKTGRKGGKQTKEKAAK